VVDRELEIAAAASLGGLASWRSRNAAKLGSPCANCGAPLEGPYCHACGQLAETFERSIWSLAREALENFFDADGRVFHTLPRLVLRPAVLTRDYIAGRRASQAPPLRLFLVVIVVFFFVGGLKGGGTNTTRFYQADTPKEAKMNLSLGGGPQMRALDAWLNPRLNYAINHQKEFVAGIEGWTHRIAIMLLPVGTLLLSVLFVFQRRFFIFDHAIFAMHSLSFMGMLFTLTTLMGMVGLGGLGGLLGFAAPTHLFVHMRGVYRTSVLGTLFRMLLLFFFSSFAVALLTLAVIVLTLNAVGAAS